MIRVVVFDFDGTLVDSNAIKLRAFAEAASRHPRGGAALDAALAAGGDRHAVFARLAGALEPDAAKRSALYRAMLARYNARTLRAVGAAPERRGARAALAALRRRGVELHVASATPRAHLVPLLRARGWLALFAGVWGSPTSKAEAVRRIRRARAIGPRDIVLVGDSPDDLAAARAAGIAFVAVRAERRIAEPVRHAVDDLRRLPTLLLALGGGPRPRRPRGRP